MNLIVVFHNIYVSNHHTVCLKVKQCQCQIHLNKAGFKNQKGERKGKKGLTPII